jgi:hypothetical protein
MKFRIFPFLDCRRYFEVIVTSSYKSYLKETAKAAFKDNTLAVCLGFKIKPRMRKVGQIIFSPAALQPGTIAHEVDHAASYLQYNFAPRTLDLTEPGNDEFRAQLVDRLTQQIYDSLPKGII